MMLNMKRIFNYISVLFAVLVLTACGSNPDDSVVAGYTGNSEPEIVNYHILDTFASYVTQKDDQFATPVVLQILLNSEPTTLAGYTIYGQNYFRIDDIAYMLRDTLARFRFDTWALFNSSWGNHVYICRGSRFDRYERIDSRGEFHRTIVDISGSVSVSRGGTTPRDIIAPIEIFITESHPYFTLESLSSFLGFTINDALYGVISIDTSEVNTSEYGRRVAEEFLSHRPSLFPRPYQNHDRDALSFMLYNIRGNGIPDIFIQYAEQQDVYAVYVYFAEEGYLFIGTVSFWHEILRDAEGRFYVVCGNMQDGFTDVRMLIVRELQEYSQWSSVLSPRAFLTNRNNTGLTFLTDMNKPATSIRPLQGDFLQEISESVTMRLATHVEATQTTVQVLLNDELISLTGHTIEGRNYFRLSDIAYMLQDTRAHFDFTENRRNLHNVDVRLNRQDGSFENVATTDSTALYPVMMELTANRTLGSTHGDVFGAGINSFGTEHYVLLTLEDLSGVLGFFLNHATDGTIIIDTNEAYISEYGRRVAKEFLMQYPTVFHPYPWSDEILAVAAEPRRMSDILGRDEWHSYDAYVFPQGFMLHDLRGGGIPDIFLSYWFWDWPTAFVIYSYFDGSYKRIGTVRMYGEIFHDRQGRIFFLEGTHQMGYDTMRTLTFNDHGAEWDTIELIDWYSITLIENLCERGRIFWEHWTHPTPVMPDNLNEPLTANRFLWDLHVTLEGHPFPQTAP